MSLIIREGKSIDMPAVLELLRELAILKGMEDAFTLTIYDLLADGFSKKKFFTTYVAESKDEIIGVALFYATYSKKGPSIVLEDIYINKKYDNTEIGLSIFSKFIENAEKNNINQLEWSIHENNKKLVELHLRAGAEILYDTHIYTINNIEIKKNSVKAKEFLPNEEVNIRIGKTSDMKNVLALLKEQCNDKEMTCNLKINDLINNGFSIRSYFKTFIVEKNEEIIGFLMFCHTYSSLKGRALIIEDLFIKPKYQDKGFGKALCYKLFEYADKHKKMRVSQAIHYLDKKAIKRSLENGSKRVNNMRIVQISKETLKEFVK